MDTGTLRLILMGSETGMWTPNWPAWHFVNYTLCTAMQPGRICIFYPASDSQPVEWLAMSMLPVSGRILTRLTLPTVLNQFYVFKSSTGYGGIMMRMFPTLMSNYPPAGLAKHRKELICGEPGITPWLSQGAPRWFPNRLINRMCKRFGGTTKLCDPPAVKTPACSPLVNQIRIQFSDFPRIGHGAIMQSIIFTIRIRINRWI